MKAWIIRHAAALCALLTVLFSALGSGCSVGSFTADSLMKPPAADGDGAGLQTAINELLGAQIFLRYPRSGEHRSAVVRANIDGDESLEALVFYRLATENTGARMAVLDTDGAKWKLVTAGDANIGEIERVMFGDLDGDGVDDIVAGWTVLSGSSRVMTAYSLVGGELRQLRFEDGSAPDGENTGGSDKVGETAGSVVNGGRLAAGQDAAVYTEVALADFDRDGMDDILSVCLNTIDGVAAARLIKLRRGAGEDLLGISATVELDGRTAEYISAQAGGISYTVSGLVLDGHRADGCYTTEAVYWDGKRLAAPLNDSVTRTCTFTRSQALTSCDINGDGVIELPSDRPMTGSTGRDGAPLYLTTWHRFVGSMLGAEMTTLMDTDDGYYLIMNEAWQERLSVRQTEETAQDDEQSAANGQDVAIFYERGASGNVPENEVMRIAVFPLDAWEKLDKWEPLDILGSDAEEGEEQKYVALMTTEYYVYAVRLASWPETSPEEAGQTDGGESENGTADPEAFTYENVMNAFRLIP